MKISYFISALILLLLFSCNNKLTGNITPAGQHWLIGKHVHTRIEKKFKKCNDLKKCKSPEVWTRNDYQYTYLEKLHPGTVVSITEDSVRYRYWDQHKYRYLWGLERGSDTGKVKHYFTKIFITTYTSNKKIIPQLSRKYYTIKNKTIVVYSYAYRICPPPNICNGFDTSSVRR